MQGDGAIKKWCLTLAINWLHSFACELKAICLTTSSARGLLETNAFRKAWRPIHHAQSLSFPAAPCKGASVVLATQRCQAKSFTMYGKNSNWCLVEVGKMGSLMMNISWLFSYFSSYLWMWHEAILLFTFPSSTLGPVWDLFVHPNFFYENLELNSISHVLIWMISQWIWQKNSIATSYYQNKLFIIVHK